jgi:putative photosynthetic complex assembly protein
MTTIRVPVAVDTTTPVVPPPDKGSWVMPGAGKRGRSFPRKVLLGAAAVLVFAIGATIFGQTTGIGVVRNPVMSPVMIRDIIITELSGDRLAVADAATRETIETIAPDKDGFIRGAMRGLNRARMQRNLPLDTPWRLIRWDNGRLTLSDTATGQRVELDAFGKTNAAAFARFLND